MKDTREKDAPEKKPYVQPRVTQVQLTPEEVVLGACKSGGTANSKSPGNPCVVCGLATGS